VKTKKKKTEKEKLIARIIKKEHRNFSSEIRF